jgi:hypothetical protein
LAHLIDDDVRAPSQEAFWQNMEWNKDGVFRYRFWVRLPGQDVCASSFQNLSKMWFYVNIFNKEEEAISKIVTSLAVRLYFINLTLVIFKMLG